MKKLIIAFATIAMAVCVNAAEIFFRQKFADAVAAVEIFQQVRTVNVPTAKSAAVAVKFFHQRAPFGSG